MRIFLRFSVGLFRQKTERIDVQPTTTTDELLEIVVAKTGKGAESFALTYRYEQVRVRIIRGWLLSHYDIRPGMTFTVELFDEVYNLPQDSMKTSKLLASVLPQGSPFELSSIEETSEEHMKESLAGTIISSTIVQDDADAIVRKYLDGQLEVLLKEAQRGSLQTISRLLRDSPELEDRPELADKANQQKQLSMINELGCAGWGVIHTAVYYDHADLVSFLLIKNCDPNIVTTDGWTALQLAVSKKSVRIARMLLEYPSVRVNELTARGTALHIAVRQQNSEMVRLLLQHQANEHAKDQDRVTPMEFANPEIRKILKQYHNAPEPVQQEASPQFMSEPPPILKGTIFKESAFYKMKERYLVCNPYEGTLIRYESEQTCPRKPIEVQPLTEISSIRILAKKELVWFMSKDYFYFQLFAHDRTIMGVKNQELAKRWVKGIFQGSVFAITHQHKHKEIQQLALKAKTLVLDDKRNAIRSVHEQANPVRPKAPTITKKQNIGFSPLLKQITQHKSNTAVPPVNQRDFEHSEVSAFSASKNESIIQKPFKKTPGASVFTEKAEPEYSLPVESSLLNFEDTEEEKPRADMYAKKESPFRLKTESAKTTTTTMISTHELDAPKVKFSSFDLLKQIGSGSFGKVFQARLKSTGEVFALKALQKRALLAKRGMKYAISEAQILKGTEHPFIVRLHYTFQTVNNLYMCMDYCSRGDLSQYIAEMDGKVPEQDAIYITGQILLALEYLHEKNIVYRDLKPQNMLLCEDGYLKLADFGLSKQLNEEDSCKTFCGSLAYISPEMLNNKEVGKHSDVYGVGCVLYQLLTGEPPYFDEDNVKLQTNIKEGRLKFPQSINPTAKELLLKLLQRDFSKRITIKQAKDHPYFRGLDFRQLLAKKIGSIQLPVRQQQDSDEQDSRLQDLKIRFVDYDYPENKTRSKVANYSFSKPAS